MNPGNVSLQMSAEFYERISKIPANFKISGFLISLQYISEQGVDPESGTYRNYLDISKDNENMISYLDRKKEERYSNTGYDLYNPDIRIKATAGKVIKAIVGNQFTDKEIMEWVTNYKKEGLKGKDIKNSEFTILKGKHIKWAYHEDNYYDSIDGSNLHNSCMRYSECQDYFDIYCNNPEQVELLAIIRNSMVRGRCLLWYPRGKNDPYKLFDRIYTITDNEAIAMRAYLEVKGYIDIYANDNYINVDIILEYGQNQIEKYPYMDTFKFLSDKTLSNNPITGCIELQCTDGSFSRNNETCPVCSNAFDEDESVTIDIGAYANERVCPDCACWIENRSEYAIPSNTVFSRTTTRNIFIDDAIFCSDIKDHILATDAILLWDGRYVSDRCEYYLDVAGRVFELDDENFVEIGEEWYGKDMYDIFWNAEEEVYEMVN